MAAVATKIATTAATTSAGWWQCRGGGSVLRPCHGRTTNAGLRSRDTLATCSGSGGGGATTVVEEYYSRGSLKPIERQYRATTLG